LRVCYFGTYERGYPRNSQVISCLRKAGVDVEEVHLSVWDDERSGWSAGPVQAARLAAARLVAAPERTARRLKSGMARSKLQATGTGTRAGAAKP